MHLQQENRNLRGPEVDQPPKAWEYDKLKAVLKAYLKHPLKRSLFLIIDAMDESDDCDRADINFYGSFQCLQSLLTRDASSKSSLLVAL